MKTENVLMPRLGVNDEYVTLGQWLVPNGSTVSKGDAIASLETTKQTQDLISEQDGYIYYQIMPGEDVKVGSPIAVICDEPQKEDTSKEEEHIDVRVTVKAKALMEKHHIDASCFPHLHLIREKDVLAFLGKDRPITRSKANDIIVVCGGGLAKMCIDLIRLNKAYNIHGVLDANPNIGPKILDVPYLGDESLLESLRKEGYMTAVNAIGSIGIDNTAESFYMRKRIYERIKSKGFFVPTLIHPSAQIAPSAQLGEGTLVFENAAIGSEAVIGDNCIINTGAVVSHDCKIGSHTRISPGALLAGNVTIGENSLIGMGVTIYLGVKIGKNVIIANGQNIMTNVPDNAIIK